MTKRSADAISDLPVILIIGASFGGLSTAVHLIERDAHAHHRIVLVDKTDKFTIGGLWQFVWNNRLKRSQILFDLNSTKLGDRVEVWTNTTVVSWDTTKKQVRFSSGKTMSYAKIVVACGAVTDPNSIPAGLADHANICSLDSIERQRTELQAIRGAAKKKSAVFVMAIGGIPYKCPVAPFEIACLVQEQLDDDDDDSDSSDHQKIIITCPIDWPMPPSTKPKFLEILNKKGITYKGNMSIEKIQNQTIYYENGEKITADCIWTNHPLKAPTFVQEALKDHIVDGFVDIADISHQVTTDVYCIGDCCQFQVSSMTIPKAGEFAWKMGASVADSITKNSPIRTDRTGRCIAELGHNVGICVENNFTDTVHGGAHRIQLTVTTNSEQDKIDWVNSYLKRIFGPHAMLSVNDLTVAK